MTEPQSSPALPTDLPDLADEGDRPSITEVNGTIAKFDMSYAPPPSDRAKFGPPLAARLPSYVYLAFALGVLGVVAAAHASSSNSALFRFIAEGDRNRPISSAALAAIIVFSAIGTVIRTHMRGVLVTGEGIETRNVLAFGVPQIKRWAWPQVHRIVMDETRVMLELWDGTYARLPAVAEPDRLGLALGRIAATRRITVTGLGERSRP